MVLFSRAQIEPERGDDEQPRGKGQPPPFSDPAVWVIAVEMQSAESEKEGVVKEYVRHGQKARGGVRAKTGHDQSHERLWDYGQRNQIEQSNG